MSLSTYAAMPLPVIAEAMSGLALAGWECGLSQQAQGQGAILSLWGPDRQGQMVGVYWLIGPRHLAAIEAMPARRAVLRVGTIARLAQKAVVRRLAAQIEDGHDD